MVNFNSYFELLTVQIALEMYQTHISWVITKTSFLTHCCLERIAQF